MNDLIGIAINYLPFKLTDFMAVLLFQEYPTTIVYQDVEGFPIIKEWIDTTPDNSIDRFYYYKTTGDLLMQFIEGELTHLELINQCINGLVIFEDSAQNNNNSFSIAPVNMIPKEYKPHYDFYFNKSDGVSLYEITSRFSPPKIEIKSKNR